MKSFLTATCLTLLTATALSAGSVSDYNVVWDTPSKDCHGSMPIGNGDIGANVWVEENGDLCFYLGKTDAIDEHARFVKLGKLRVRLTPNPIANGGTFKQELDLSDGVIKITASAQNPAAGVDLRFWVDANHPAVRITGSSTVETEVEVIFEPWRTERTPATWDRSFTGLADKSLKHAVPYPVFIEPDTIVEGRRDSILWYHRNKTDERSVWVDTLKAQGLGDFMKQSSDPLRNLTFGALVRGTGLAGKSAKSIKSAAPAKTFDISIHPLTRQTASAEEWIQQVEALAAENSKISQDAAWNAHKRWWNEFWNRSWIRVKGAPGDDTFVVSQGYALQSWITACGGRGRMPIKFNGSIFTVDGYEKNQYKGPDYRAWGSAFWFQNTRLPYWPLMTAGHYDLMQPLFKMYLDALPLAKFRGQTYYGFGGAYFPETMYFWGTYSNEDHGWSRKPGQKPDELPPNSYIQYLWSGGIELTAMMLEYHRHTQDSDFLKTTLLPFAREIAAFYDNRYPRGEDGKLIIEPANAQEDIWGCRNPMPEVAGLRYILPQLVRLATAAEDKALYQRLLEAIPDLPKGKSRDGLDLLLPAEVGSERRRGNCEKPECYAIFPFRHYGVGLPDLELARETFRQSPKSMNGQPRSNGWVQDPIFAACVGDTDGAAQRLIERSRRKNKESRFPAFWGPNFDWTPDQCHGGVNMTALQKMLLQTEATSDKLHLFPAWPKDWDVSFKLHAPGKTIIQGELRNGQLVDLLVTPESRKKDVVNHLSRQTKP